MPVLPTLETSQSVFNNVALRPQEIQSSPADFGALTGEAAKGIGQAAEGAGEQVADAGLRQLDLQREANANQSYTGYANDSRALTDKLFALQGQDAITQAPQIQQQLDTLRQTYRDNLKDPVAQQMFDQVSTRHTQNILDEVSRFADTQTKVYQRQVSDGMVNTFQQSAARHWNDPNAFNGDLASIAVERTTQGQTEGQPAEYTSALIQRDVSSTWIDRLKGMAAAGTAQTALTLLNNGEDWTDSTGRTRHTDVRSQILPQDLPAIQSELSSHAADQIGVSYGNTATAPAAASGAIPGIRNNNPGNLKDPATGQFQTFASQQQGIQAADANLLAYQTKHGINTIDGIVNRWAPQGDGNNNPATYGAAVAKATGIGVDQKIDLTDPAVRTKVLNAMLDVETPGWRSAANQTPAGGAPGAVSGTLPVGNAAGVPNAAQIAPPPVGLAQDPAQMRENQDAAAEQARQAAQAHVLQLTGDQTAAKRAGDVAASTVVGNTNAAIAAQQSRQQVASGTLAKMIAGDPTNGTQPITSMAQLVADPVAYANFRQLSQEGQAAVTERLSNPAKVQMTPQGFNTYYQLRGQAINDPGSFSKQDLSKLYGTLPEAQLGELVNLQMTIGKGDAAQAQKSLDWSRTKGDVDDMLKPLGLGATAKSGSDEAKTTEQFYGKLQASLEQYKDQNQKYPDTATTRKLAAALLIQGTQGDSSILPSWLGGAQTMPAFQSPDMSKFHAPQNDKGWSLHIDKNGNQAYVSPDGKQFQAVQ